MSTFGHSTFKPSPAAVGLSRHWNDDDVQAHFVLDCANSVYHHLIDGFAAGKAASLRHFREIIAHLHGELFERRDALVRSVRDMRDQTDTCSHELRAAVLMMNFAWELDLPRREQAELGMAGLLHDVGKLAVPQAILDKPGPLDASEIARMRLHCEDGEAMLRRLGVQSDTIIDVCRHHHERCDGSGYPDGLIGRQNSLAGRMGMICDVFDALTSRRAYKDAWSPGDAIAEMRSHTGHFDLELLDAFAGSLAGLESQI